MAKNKLPIAKATTSAPTPMPVDRDDDMKWKAKNALDDIKRAEGHKADEDLMRHVKQCAKQEMKTLKKL